MERRRWLERMIWSGALGLALLFGPRIAAAQQEAGEPEDKETEEAETGGETESSGDDKAAESAAMTYSVDGKVLTARRGGEVFERFGLPCEGQDALRSGENLYVACGEKGLLVLSVQNPESPSQLGFRDLGAPVENLFEANGRVWAQIQRIEARPVEGPGQVTAVTRPPAGPDAGRPEETGRPEEKDAQAADDKSAPVQRADQEDKAGPDKIPAGKVVEVRAETAVVDFGRAQGLRSGARVELFRKRQVELGSGQTATRERTFAVGRVVALGDDRAEVELGMNEQVEVGDRARRSSKDITATVLAPPRPGGVSTYEFMVRPFLPLNVLGFGMVGSLSYTHAFEWPGLLEIRLNPASFGVADEGNVLAIAGDVSLSYDIKVFRIGLGAGVGRLVDRVFPRDPSTQPGGSRIERTANLNITQFIRFGARDGLHVRADNSFLLASQDDFQQDDDLQFVYGGTNGQIQVPLHAVLDDTWLLFRGGGHRVGQYYGEMGLRFMTTGNGGPGSLFLTTTLGGAGVFGPSNDNGDNNYGGPMVGFGVEWRN